MEAKIIEKTDEYIVHRSRFGDEHKFWIVDTVPVGYRIWNIGEHAPEGYIPLCLCDHDYHVDVTSLKAVRVENELDRMRILEAAGWGAESLVSAEKNYRRLLRKKHRTHLEEHSLNKIGASLRALRNISWEKSK